MYSQKLILLFNKTLLVECSIILQIPKTLVYKLNFADIRVGIFF